MTARSTKVQSANEVISIFSEDVPTEFLKKFGQGLNGTYGGSFKLCREVFSRPERHDIHSTVRRAVTEMQFRSLAKQYTGHVKTHQTRRGAARYTAVRFNRVILTQAGVADIDEVVRRAVYRNALSIGQLPLLPSNNEVSANSDNVEGLIYGILLHGPRRAEIERPTFYRVAFPTPDCSMYAAALPLTEMLSDVNPDSEATQEEDPSNFFRPRREEDEEEEG